MLTRRGVLVQRLTASECDELTVTSDSDPPKKVVCYRECPPGFLVPRHWCKGFSSRSPSMRESNIYVPFKGQLKQAQEHALEKTVRGLLERGGGLLCLPTGRGKTVIALKAACDLGLKTLIIVHKTFLLDQWRERIATFCPTARVGTIQGKVVDVEDKDIVLGTMQSTAMKNHPVHVYVGFGLLVIDEAHHCPAETFSDLFFKANCAKILALSATPERRDGLHKLLGWFVGPVLHHETLESAAEVCVQVTRYHCPSWTTPDLQRKGAMSRMINVLARDRTRTEMILRAIEPLVDLGRHVLVLSDRREHCAEIAKALGDRAGLYLGGMPKDLADRSLRKSVVVATYSLVSEGFDLPSLDAVVLATPRSDVRQAVGRILRDTPGKRHAPLVLDILDEWSLFVFQGRKRRRFYAEAGFRVVE